MRKNLLFTFILISLTVLISHAQQYSPEKQFWDYFTTRVRHVDSLPYQPKLLSAISRQLLKIDSSLGMGMLMQFQDKQVIHVIYITAHGNAAKFDQVRQLVAASPVINNAKIIAFEPAGYLPDEFSVGETKIKTRDVYFTATNDSTLSVEFYLQVIKDDDREDFLNQFQEMVYHFIGEYAFAQVNTLGINDISSAKNKAALKPLKELPQTINKLLAK